MRTRLVGKWVGNMTEEEFNRCSSLNMRGKGAMRKALHSKRGSMEDAAYMIKAMDGSIIAWAIVFWQYTGDKYPTMYYYTRKAFRRQGYASRLARQIAKDYNSKVYFIPWDDASHGFNNYLKVGQKKLLAPLPL